MSEIRKERIGKVIQLKVGDIVEQNYSNGSLKKRVGIVVSKASRPINDRVKSSTIEQVVFANVIWTSGYSQNRKGSYCNSWFDGINEQNQEHSLYKLTVVDDEE